MGTSSTLATLAIELFAALLAPPRCAACDAPVARLSVFCAACAHTAEIASNRDRGDTVAAFLYGGAVARAIVKMKYESRPDLARPLGDLLWRALSPQADRLRQTLVVPVPLHPARLAERGFNQSALLARRVAGHLGAPLAPRALSRHRDTPRQATLDRETRLANVTASFGVREPTRIRDRTVLLVDDVRTTGATLGACAEALRSAGAGTVLTAVVARA
jgi:ComF family protein